MLRADVDVVGVVRALGFALVALSLALGGGVSLAGAGHGAPSAQQSAGPQCAVETPLARICAQGGTAAEGCVLEAGERAAAQAGGSFVPLGTRGYNYGLRRAAAPDPEPGSD